MATPWDPNSHEGDTACEGTGICPAFFDKANTRRYQNPSHPSSCEGGCGGTLRCTTRDWR